STSIETDYYGLTAGQTYYISVDNFVGTGYRGTFSLCLSDVVDYNFYEGAADVTTLINGCSANGAYTTLNATADRSAGTCWSNGPNYNRWFKFTASGTHYIKAQVKVGGAFGTMQYPMVAIWDASLTQLNCQNQQGASTSIETDYYGLTTGQTYYISVDNFVGTGYRGTFSLCLSDVVDYNYYEGATDVTGYINKCSPNAAYTTLNATADRAAGTCWSNGPNYNRWFKFTASATQYIKISVNVGGASGTMQYPMVALWTSALAQLNCQNQQGASTSIETDYFGLTAGQTYYISVDNFVGTGYRGTFSLCLSDVPDYNYYEGAADVTSLINGCSTNAAYTTLNATADRAAGSCWSNGPNYNRWFKFTATATQYIKVSVNVGGASGTMQYPMVALWTSALAQLNCQNQQGASTSIETDYFGLTAGQVYYISVDNFVGTGYRGTFTLCLSDVMDYNYYEGAIALTDLNNWCSSNAQYTTLNATPDKNKGTCWSNGPNYNRWFKFTAGYTSATIQVKVGGVEGTMQYPMVALWGSNGTSQLACTNQAGASTDISMSYASLTVGNTYYISVDNFVGTGYRGTFTLCITNVNPTQYYSRANGDWSNTNTWSTIGFGGAAAGTLPGAGNIVNIQDNAVAVTSAQTCAEIVLTNSAAATSLTIDNATLTVNGKVTQTNSGNNTSTLTLQNNGSMSILNSYNLNRNGGTGGIQVVLTAGSLSVGQDMNWNETAGTVALNTLTASNSSSVSVTRDLYLNWTGGMKQQLTFNNNATLDIGRDFALSQIAAGISEAIFNNSAQLRLKRNVLRGGTPYGNIVFNGSSTFVFNGTANQQIIPASAGAGGDAISYNNVTFNNTSGFLYDYTMGGVANIPGTLTLTNGVAQTTSVNYIQMLSGSTNGLGSSSSYISGPFYVNLASSVPSTLNLPIGKSSDYRPVILNVTHSDATSVTYNGELFNASAAALLYTIPGTIERVSGAHYWIVNRSAVANLTTATATLYYGSNDGVSDPPNLRFVKTNGAGTVWFDLGGTGSAAPSGFITSNAFTTFSTMTIANATGGTNSLPIQLIDFKGTALGDKVELSWTTATEVNNDYFGIERSEDGLLFTEIARVPGKGTSFVTNRYTFTDESPRLGRSYYRLSQTDFNKQSTLSKVIYVDVNKVDPNVLVYPNPSAGDSFSIGINGLNSSEEVQVIIYDLTGKQVLSFPLTAQSNGSARVDVSKTLSSGFYIVTVQALSGRMQTKLVVR
ncbi:MAG: T9SS type A sorting domain-containing protein, partial [Bacteroidetes bacterium]|nr:T9SS type A sorting domain-containing protein [Bacteroidota bacterium]